jgi:maleylacetoacetate isomerase
LLKLYGYFRSSAAFRVRIGLNLKGLDYEQTIIHLRKGEQRLPFYLDLNPQGMVPSLVDGPEILSQSIAILEYLEETRPDPPLLPNDFAGRARVRALTQIIASDIHPLNNLRILNYLREELGQSEEALGRWFNRWIAEGFKAIEAEIHDDPDTGLFLHGDKPSLADVCLVPQVLSARRYDLDMSPYPTIQRIYDYCMALPAFDAAQPSNQPDAE